MSGRELVVLGTASQVPTRRRNHNGYLLRWDGDAVLFDPGEGTQRQLTFAGVAPPSVRRICITHFHGDHCLGLPGVLQRLALDGVESGVEVDFPASGAPYVERLRGACIGRQPEVTLGGVVDGDRLEGPGWTLTARALHHRVDTVGWRLEEPAGRTMLADRLDALGVRGPDVGRLQAEGTIEAAGRRVTLEEVSVPRPGQAFAFVMDTALCDAAFELAAGADLLVAEATFLTAEEHLAREYTHLTAAQAARIAAEAGARRLVLTHLSQRYLDPAPVLAEARAVFDDVVVAEDLMTVPLPPRRASPPS